MKKLLVAAGAATAALSAAPAYAVDHPSFRFCEAGYVNRNVDLDETSQTSEFTAALNADDGSGFRAACTLELLLGIFVHGEFTQADIDFQAVVDDGLGTDEFNSDVTNQSLRIGAGLALDIPLLPISAYGQASYTQEQFDAGSFVDETTGAVENVEQDDSGFDLEVGARAVLLNRIDGGVFVRYTDIGAIEVPNSSSDILEAEEDVRFGAQAALRVIGPAWATVRYEAGDVDTIFVGGRIAF